MVCAPPRGTKSRRGVGKKQPGGSHAHTKQSSKRVGYIARPTRQARPDISAVSDLTDDPSTEIHDKLERARALHAKWIHEDAECVAEGEELKARQHERCKEIGLVVFGFVLHEAQVEAIWTLFYEQQDLILIAKTGFGKSLVFQLLPFMTGSTGVGLVLMPLKLLQAEQSEMINRRIPGGKAIVLNGENNQPHVRKEIAIGGYTHLFTSPEIALSKDFKDDILGRSEFTDRLCLLAIDEIHLTEEWGKRFRPLYSEISKVRKRVPCHVPLLGVSATLTKRVRGIVIEKAGFRLENTRLMQTSLDRPEIMQVHRFMKHPKASCLDLQFILPETASRAKDIQKTIVFVNSVTEIFPMLEIIRAWMKRKNFPAASRSWIKHYFANMSEYDKELTAAEFRVLGEDNTECTILVATDAYGMGIDNPDVALVIQWDLPLSFDTMIQRMGRAGRKGGASTFVLLSPKWTVIQDPQEIEQRLSERKNQPGGGAFNAQLSASNRPTAVAKISPLSQVISAEDDVSDSGSVAESEASGAEYDLDEDDFIANVLATEADERHTEHKIKKKRGSTDAKKRADIPDEIFDYIHVARCRRLFSLAWYNDLTYAIEAGSSTAPVKALPDACCNGPSCHSAEPAFLQREPFILPTKSRLSESDREWIACRTAELKSWRKQELARVCVEESIEKWLPDSIILSDCCIAALAKNGEDLLNPVKLLEFLEPWAGAEEYCDEILACIRKNSAGAESDGAPAPIEGMPSKTERKAILQAARLSKKLKGMDDPCLAEEFRVNAMRDEWLVNTGSADAATTARVKKATDAARKLADKQDKVQNSKSGSKNENLNARKLALANSQRQSEIGTYKAILSDPPMPNDDDSHAIDDFRVLTAAKPKQGFHTRKNATTARLSAARSTRQLARPNLSPPPPPPPAMELEREGTGKRTVRVTAKAVANTPTKRMRVARPEEL